MGLHPLQDSHEPATMPAPEGRPAPFVRRHATGLTTFSFLIVAAMLGAAPVPDILRPVSLASTDDVRAVLTRVFKKPRMTLASLEAETASEGDAEAGEADADDTTTDDTTTEDSAESVAAGESVGQAPVASSPLASAVPAATTHLANVTQDNRSPAARATLDVPAGAAPIDRDRREPTPGKRALALRKLAETLGAPGTSVENPCIHRDERGCARTALDPFFVTLDAVDRKEPGSHATIVTLGNSLIASDHVTDVVRNRLVARFGSGGRGFLLPERLSKAAGRRARTGKGTPGWEFHTFAQKSPGISLFGFSGSAHESTQRGDRIRWLSEGANRARLFYLDGPRSVPFTVEVDGNLVSRIEPTSAESENDRVLDFEFPPQSERITVTASEAGVVLYGLALSSDAPGVVFDTIGVPASDASMYLGADEGAFVRQLQAREPSLVVLMIGGNEIRSLAFGWTDLDTVRRDYGALIERIQRAVPDAACLAVAPIDAARATAAGAELTTRPETLDIVAMEAQVAREKGCAFLNLFEAMGGEGALHRFHEKGLIHDDLVHPRGKGGDVLGQLFADALLKSYRDTPLPRLDVRAHRRLVPPTLLGLQFPTVGAAMSDASSHRPPRPLRELFRKLRALEQGAARRLSIGHFGGTHAAEHSLSDRIRERLGERFGAAGRGFVSVGFPDAALLPGRVVRSLTGSAEVSDGHDVVLGGAAAMNGTKARLLPGARFDVSFCDGCREGRYRPRGMLELSWLYTPDMGVADVYVNDVHVGVISPQRRRIESDVQFLRIPVRGEAHTLSVVVSDGRSDTARRRRMRLEDDETRVAPGPVNLLGVSGEVHRAGVVVDSLGLQSSTGAMLTRYRADLIAEQVAARDYDLILSSWGHEEAASKELDEARYASAYERGLRLLREASPDAACILIGPTDRLVRVRGQWAPAPHHEVVERVQRDVAARLGCAYFDARTAMGGPGVMAGWHQEGLARSDHATLTPEGYEHFGDLFLEDLFAAFAFEKSLIDAEAGSAPIGGLARAEAPSSAATGRGADEPDDAGEVELAADGVGPSAPGSDDAAVERD